MTYVVAVVAVVLVCVAECFSVRCVATTDNINCAIEDSLWMVAFALQWVGALGLMCHLRNVENPGSAKTFCTVLLLYATVYVPYEWLVDVPMYFERWRQDQEAGKDYFSFVDGLEDAAVTRVVDHSMDTWRPEMLWMLAYFSLGVWSSLALMTAPRVPSHTRCKRLVVHYGRLLSPNDHVVEFCAAP